MAVKVLPPARVLVPWAVLAVAVLEAVAQRGQHLLVSVKETVAAHLRTRVVLLAVVVRALRGVRMSPRRVVLVVLDYRTL